MTSKCFFNPENSGLIGYLRRENVVSIILEK